MKQMIKIIFLDIDGVLNCEDTFIEQRVEYDKDREAYIKKLQDRNFMEDSDIDKKLVNELNKIIRATGAKIVVSSSWRIGRTVDELRHLLKRNGCIGEVIDRTGRSSHGIRGLEIQEWLDNYTKCHIENFIILDDDADMEHLHSFLIRHNFKYGLTPKLRNIAINRLNSMKSRCPIEKGLYPGTISMKTYTEKYEVKIHDVTQIDPIKYWDELTTMQRMTILRGIREKGDCVWSIPYRFSEEMF